MTDVYHDYETHLCTMNCSRRGPTRQCEDCIVRTPEQLAERRAMSEILKEALEKYGKQESQS